MSFTIKGKPQFIYEVRTYRFCTFDDNEQKALSFAAQMAMYGRTQYTVYKYINNRYQEIASLILQKRSDWI